MIELKDFQQKAVDSLLSTFRRLTSRGEPIHIRQPVPIGRFTFKFKLIVPSGCFTIYPLSDD